MIVERIQGAALGMAVTKSRDFAATLPALRFSSAFECRTTLAGVLVTVRLLTQRPFINPFSPPISVASFECIQTITFVCSHSRIAGFSISNLLEFYARDAGKKKLA
jgi:hypothetical protein